MTLSGCFSYLLVLVFFNLTTKRLCAYFFLFILIRIWWICYLWDLWFINSGKFSAIQMPLPHSHYYFLLEIWLYVLDLITVFPVALECFSILCFSVPHPVQFLLLNLIVHWTLLCLISHYSCYALFYFISLIFHFQRFYCFQFYTITSLLLYYVINLFLFS